ncbi:MAG: DUF1566 domain-containing protein [Burkholderiales bacterium]|nr:DUF1566 domain-containing protein [Burkholderiales bacterium]
MDKSKTLAFLRSCLLLGLVAMAGVAAAASIEDGHEEQFPNRHRYTKIGSDGSTLDKAARLGVGAGNWVCSIDEETGLMWEIKTSDGGLRDRNHTYTPYDSNPKTNGGWIGYRDTRSGNCDRTQMHEASCNTESYINALNASRLCGHADWRLPTIPELVAIAGESSSSPDADVALPNTAEGWYWTGVSKVGHAVYSRVILLPPRGRAYFYDGSYMVRAVRDGRTD